jgi:hypothetical protein
MGSNRWNLPSGAVTMGPFHVLRGSEMLNRLLPVAGVVLLKVMVPHEGPLHGLSHTQCPIMHTCKCAKVGPVEQIQQRVYACCVACLCEQSGAPQSLQRRMWHCSATTTRSHQQDDSLGSFRAPQRGPRMRRAATCVTCAHKTVTSGESVRVGALLRWANSRVRVASDSSWTTRHTSTSLSTHPIEMAMNISTARCSCGCCR